MVATCSSRLAAGGDTVQNTLLGQPRKTRPNMTEKLLTGTKLIEINKNKTSAMSNMEILKIRQMLLFTRGIFLIFVGK